MTEITPTVSKSTLNLGYIAEVLRRSQTDFTPISSRDTFDLADLCTHKNINMWSKRKPIRDSRLFMTEAQLDSVSLAKNYGLNMPYYRSNTNSCLIDLAKAVADGTAVWSYNRPRGGTAEPFRLGDFRNYCHKINWDEGVQPGVPSVIDFPLCISLQAGNNDGYLEKGQILRMYNQGIGQDETNTYALSTTNLMDCVIGDNAISYMRIGIALIPCGIPPTYDNVQVFLSGVQISAIDDDLVYDLVTTIGTIASGQEYYVIPFLYFGLEYAEGPKPTTTVSLQKVVKSPSVAGYACVSMIGDKIYTKTATTITYTSITASLAVGTNAVATITFKIGSETQRYRYMYVVLCSEAMSQYDYINDTEVPYSNAAHYFMMGDTSLLGSIGITDGCGNKTITSVADGTNYSGVVSIAEAVPVRYKTGNDTSTTFGWAVDARLALGELKANTTYTLKLTFPRGVTSDAGGTLTDILLFMADSALKKYEVMYL